LQLFIEKNSLDQLTNQYLYLKTIKKTAQTLARKLQIEKSSLDTLYNELKQNQNQIKKSISASNKLIQNKQLSVQEKESQLDSLENQTRLQKELVNTLNNQIDLLKKEISEKEISAQKIENEIKKINNKIISSKNKDVDLLTNNFQIQKGNLDWPSANCIVMSSFGTVSHQSLPGIKYINHGIGLAISKNSYVKSVFAGTVSSIIIQTNSLKSIIIEHGLYFTVYTNLSEVYIKQGDEVQKLESIGKPYIKENHKTGLIEFQLWKEFESLNPKIWLKKR
jgi:murein hydrolase activator